jgi:DNA polymerase-1
MCVDLKQAEVIGMLWCAEQWEILKKILFEGMDAHFALAQQILGRDPTKQERTDFKTTTFAILYGEADKTTAYRLGVPLEEVKRARDMYYEMLPGVLDAREQFIMQAMSRGFVESPFGVRRYIRVETGKGRAANQAANAPIQNIPPMVIGYKMLQLARELPKPARLWLQVHDEVGLTYPKHMRDEVEKCVRDVFRVPVKEMPSAPLGQAGGLVFPIDVEVGANWGAVQDISRARELAA